MSASGDIVRELIAGGANYEQIGQALGRNRSLIRQVGIGSKPGHNLQASLEELRDRLAAGGAPPSKAAPVSTPPARRTTSRGRAARVRTKTTYGGRGWGSGAVKRQAVRSGARGLHKLIGQAAENGDDLAVTVTFDKGIRVQGYGKGKRTRQGAGGVLDFTVDADAASAHVAAGGTFAEYVAGEAMRAGYVSGQAGPAGYVAHMLSLEARAY